MKRIPIRIHTGLLFTMIAFVLGSFNSFGQCSPDITDPVTPILPDLMGECVVDVSSPTTTDFCDGTITGTTTDPLIYTAEGTYTISWTFTDIAGNSIVAAQNVIVDDFTDPVPDLALLPVVNAECEVSSITPPVAIDNCSAVITAVTSTIFPITTPGSTTVVWSYDDGNGNVITQNQTVNIQDLSSPVPDLGNLADVTSECEVASISAPSATDICSGFLLGTTSTVFPITVQGTTVVTWAYDDGNGNTSTQNQNVVINDITAPVADLPTLDDVTANCQVTSLTAPSASDNCSGNVSGTTTTALPITTQGTTTIIWTYDDGNGNFTTQTQDVVIDDNIAPVADLASLPSVTGECDVTSLTPPTATDNCAGAITGTHNAILPITIQGTTIVTWTYDDGNGNIETQVQEVIINDVSAPVPDLPTLADVTADCSLTALTPPTATDNCSGFVTVSNDADLPYTTIGTYVVTWMYTDATGNISAQTQNIIIQDVTGPVVDPTTIEPIIADCQVLALVTPTATDDCGGNVTITNDAVLPITTLGASTITWTFTDDQGNVTTASQDVTINLTETCLDLVTVNDVITPNGDDVNDFWVMDNVQFTDGCNVKIFNRWGTQLYETDSYDNTWNGTSVDGDILPGGVYYYIIQCDDNVSFQGYITIVR
ncbi:MAG: gliding motility-associated C-terminal domain-containing protein [Crocinitomicaceae bacterium]|nr:gliding motility-associated C-terminal domain-containing protein [Crocinitomicaceae bacterium]